jgi:DNA-binding transcriptional MerR regulator
LGTPADSALPPVEKAPEAFRSISEVAASVGVPQHVLRFWETRFNQIRPMKRAGGRRFYRPHDVDLINGIKKLLYEHRYTIRGVQMILREKGPAAVVSIGRGEKPGPDPAAAEPGAAPAASGATGTRAPAVHAAMAPAAHPGEEELRLALTDLAAAKRILESFEG